MNIEVHISFKMCFLLFFFFFFLDLYPGVGLLDHVAALFLAFEESPFCFLQWLHQFTDLPTSVQMIPLFSISSQTFVICRHFWNDLRRIDISSCFLLLLLLVEFPCEAVQFWTLICWGFLFAWLNYKISFTTCYQFVQILFLLDSVLAVCMFLEFCPFFLVVQFIGI